MIIRILLVVVILVLFFVANYLNKHSISFSQVLAGDNEPKPIQAMFKTFAKTCLVLALIGLIFLIIGQQLFALAYIAIVMLASAVFSINLSKLIS